MRTNKLTKEQIFPMLRGCLIKLQPEEDADETVKVRYALQYFYNSEELCGNKYIL